MFEGNNSNPAATPILSNPFQYSADASNHLQLCGNLPVEFHTNPVNYLGNNRGPPFFQPHKRSRNPEARQLLNIESLNNVTDTKASIFSNNPVCTGLRLSCDDDERNSSLTSASGSLTATTLSVISSLNDIKRELNQQHEELNHFIRTQEENMVKGLGDIRQRQTVSFMSALEKTIFQKLHEKDVELETITCRNKELVETMKRATAEAQNWHYMAKYNESVVNILKTNLQQAMQSSNEGFGENDGDDAASCIDPNNYPDKKMMICRCCQSKQVSKLLMPCRHLCVCKECEIFVSVCPVCQTIKTDSFDVYFS